MIRSRARRCELRPSITSTLDNIMILHIWYAVPSINLSSSRSPNVVHHSYTYLISDYFQPGELTRATWCVSASDMPSCCMSDAYELKVAEGEMTSTVITAR